MERRRTRYPLARQQLRKLLIMHNTQALIDASRWDAIPVGETRELELIDLMPFEFAELIRQVYLWHPL